MIVLGIYCFFIIYYTESATVSEYKDSKGDRNTCIVFSGKAAENILQLLSENSSDNKKCKVDKPRDCGDLDKDKCPSGVYKIYPAGQPGFQVFCEMKKDGGGWTVIQRRHNGYVSFYRGWDDYRRGFGSVNGEYWLGNDHIYEITSQGSYALRIDLEDFDHNHAYAKYSMFSVESGHNRYKLHVSGYSGNAGNGMDHHNGRPFSTKDRDYDALGNLNCAQLYKGGWWYGACHNSNLNGLYHRGHHNSNGDGVNWGPWLGDYYSLKTTVMMIKRN